jgi:hypothetical protein
MLKKFTIYGERCSGTNFLEKAIEENFDLKITWDYDFKHWFGHYQFKKNETEDETLFLGIIRNPITWIDSFYKNPHHLPLSNKKNIKNFLFNEFCSFDDDDTNNEIMLDRNLITKKRYKNIFDLRYIKNIYLINVMPKNVKNYLLLRYEDLYDNYDLILGYIEKKFNLKRKNTDFKKIINYKGKKDGVFVKKNIKLTKKIVDIIVNNLNKEQEIGLGYIEDIEDIKYIEHIEDNEHIEDIEDKID